MPAYWTITPKAPGTAPGAFALTSAAGAEYRLDLRPNISMGNRGFVRVISISALFLALPLIAVLGTPVLWGLLPFMGLVLWALWYALMRNRSERETLYETLRLTRDAFELTHVTPHRPAQHWQANPFWVRISLQEKGGPVENYLTLREGGGGGGGGREVELGRFLSPDERATLHDDLSRALRHLR
ncbi:DUF2244 domain-containing protein [Roseinatronobacter alkalisoli]|uniref:DUF2244 domain-containing protein n=1 Tax=Roseinatronobacter alkalisoli TaxID=3028235 RepID=A0ABT5T9C7_9RHOB|nr:DUF2244 domain-containing protein [Roseinatronobacter sp. HJB301]MDD7971722.1 DUF2244 domain-containing protein [Roseinatronobacter sp. HJB301]